MALADAVDVVKGGLKRMYYGSDSPEYKEFVDSKVLNDPEMQEKSEKTDNGRIEALEEAEAAGISKDDDSCGLTGACADSKSFDKWGTVAEGVIYKAFSLDSENVSDIIAAAKYVTQDEFSGDNFGKKIERFISAVGSNLSSEGQTYTNGVTDDNLAARKDVSQNSGSAKFSNVEEIYQGDNSNKEEVSYDPDM